MKRLGFDQHEGYHQKGGKEGQKAEPHQVGQTLGENSLLGQKEDQNVGGKKEKKGGEEVDRRYGYGAGEGNPPAGQAVQLTRSAAGVGRGDGGDEGIGQVGFDAVYEADFLQNLLGEKYIDAHASQKKVHSHHEQSQKQKLNFERLKSLQTLPAGGKEEDHGISENGQKNE